MEHYRILLDPKKKLSIRIDSYINTGITKYDLFVCLSLNRTYGGNAVLWNVIQIRNKTGRKEGRKENKSVR